MINEVNFETIGWKVNGESIHNAGVGNYNLDRKKGHRVEFLHNVNKFYIDIDTEVNITIRFGEVYGEELLQIFNKAKVKLLTNKDVEVSSYLCSQTINYDDMTIMINYENKVIDILNYKEENKPKKKMRIVEC